MNPSIHVKGAWAEIFGCPATELEECLTVLNPKRFYSQAFKDKRWDGKVRLYQGRTFPAGLVSVVVQHLNTKGCDVKVVGKEERKPVDPARMTKDYLPPVGKFKEFWQPQFEAILAMLQNPRGVIKSPTGCHVKGQGILMYDGSIKKVENIKEGDLLMGPDSQPRTVLQLIRGEGKLYDIIPTKGQPFRVNEDHVLTLVRTNSAHYVRESSTRQYGRRKNGEIVDVSVRNWLGWTKTQKHLYKLFRVPVNFHEQVQHLLTEPYLLGILLGDGTLTQSRVGATTDDEEIVDMLEDAAASYGLHINTQAKNRCPSYYLTGERGKGNLLLDEIRDLGLGEKTSGEKFIPTSYLITWADDRLDLLAGLIDSDGSEATGCYDICWKSKQLADDTAFLARSLGFAAYVRETRKECTTTGVSGKYWRLSISGDVSRIPCRLLRKQAGPRKQKKNVLRTGFNAEPAGTGNYYGFTLDGDGRYLLDDFTVTHNSGKTEMMCAVARYFWEERGWRSLIVVPKKGILSQTVERFERYYQGDIEVGMYGDGIKRPGDIAVGTAQTLMSYKPRVRKSKKKGRTVLPRDDEIKKMIMHYEVLFLDECHHSSSDSWYEIALNSGAIRRYGLSGTPLKGDDIADMRMIGATGPILYDCDPQTLIDLNLAARPRIVMVMSDKVSGEELPVEHHVYYVKGQALQRVKRKGYAEAYVEGVVENTLHNTAVVRACSWLVDNGKQTLVLCRRKAHWLYLKELLDGAGLDFRSVWGATETPERDEAKKLFSAGKINLILASTIFDEGEDVPAIEAIVLAEGVKVTTNVIQRVGRGMRRKAGDNDVWIVDFAPVCHKKLFEHALKRVQAYGDEGYEVILWDKWPDADSDEDLLPFLHWDDTVQELVNA